MDRVQSTPTPTDFKVRQLPDIDARFPTSPPRKRAVSAPHHSSQGLYRMPTLAVRRPPADRQWPDFSGDENDFEKITKFCTEINDLFNCRFPHIAMKYVDNTVSSLLLFSHIDALKKNFQNGDYAMAQNAAADTKTNLVELELAARQRRDAFEQALTERTHASRSLSEDEIGKYRGLIESLRQNIDALSNLLSMIIIDLNRKSAPSRGETARQEIASPPGRPAHVQAAGPAGKLASPPGELRLRRQVGSPEKPVLRSSQSDTSLASTTQSRGKAKARAEETKSPTRRSISQRLLSPLREFISPRKEGLSSITETTPAPVHAPDMKSAKAVFTAAPPLEQVRMLCDDVIVICNVLNKEAAGETGQARHAQTGGAGSGNAGVGNDVATITANPQPETRADIGPRALPGMDDEGGANRRSADLSATPQSPANGEKDLAVKRPHALFCADLSRSLKGAAKSFREAAETAIASQESHVFKEAKKIMGSTLSDLASSLENNSGLHDLPRREFILKHLKKASTLASSGKNRFHRASRKLTADGETPSLWSPTASGLKSPHSAFSPDSARSPLRPSGPQTPSSPTRHRSPRLNRANRPRAVSSPPALPESSPAKKPWEKPLPPLPPQPPAVMPPLPAPPFASAAQTHGSRVAADTALPLDKDAWKPMPANPVSARSALSALSAFSALPALPALPAGAVRRLDFDSNAQSPASAPAAGATLLGKKEFGMITQGHRHRLPAAPTAAPARAIATANTTAPAREITTAHTTATATATATATIASIAPEEGKPGERVDR